VNRQEVNLYTIDFHRGDQPFSFRMTVIAVAIFVVALLLVNGYTTWDMMKNKKSLAATNVEFSQATDRVAELKNTRPLSQRVAIQKEIDELVEKYEKRNRLMDVIGGQKMGNGEGFSLFLQALSRQALPGISLTEFNILQGGSYVELVGWTVKPESVPFYLNRLRDEEVFRQVKFGVLTIQKDDRYTNKLHFSLGKAEFAGS